MATSKQKISMTGQRFLVKPIEEPGTTKGGLFVPDVAKNKPTEGIVRAVGDGDQDTTYTGKWPPAIEKGDRVLYGKWSGTELILEDTGEKFQIVGIDEILAVLK